MSLVMNMRCCFHTAFLRLLLFIYILYKPVFFSSTHKLIWRFLSIDTCSLSRSQTDITLCFYVTPDSRWVDSGPLFHQENRFLWSPTVSLRRLRNNLRLRVWTTCPWWAVHTFALHHHVRPQHIYQCASVIRSVCSWPPELFFWRRFTPTVSRSPWTASRGRHPTPSTAAAWAHLSAAHPPALRLYPPLPSPLLLPRLTMLPFSHLPPPFPNQLRLLSTTPRMTPLWCWKPGSAGDTRQTETLSPHHLTSPALRRAPWSYLLGRLLARARARPTAVGDRRRMSVRACQESLLPSRGTASWLRRTWRARAGPLLWLWPGLSTAVLVTSWSGSWWRQRQTSGCDARSCQRGWMWQGWREPPGSCSCCCATGTRT